MLEFNNYCHPGSTIPRAWASKWIFQGFKWFFSTLDDASKAWPSRWISQEFILKNSTSNDLFKAWPSRWISQEFRYICNIRLIAIVISNVITQNGWFLTLNINCWCSESVFQAYNLKTSIPRHNMNVMLLLKREYIICAIYSNLSIISN